MRRTLFLAPIIVVAALASPARAEVNPAALLPDGFLIEKLVKADLDGDAKPDYVVIGTDGTVPIPEENTASDGEGNRLLLVVSSSGKVFGTGKNAIICRRCGGAFWGVLVPTIEVKITRGLINVWQYAGANEVTDWNHRYRIEKGRVRLVGIDRGVTNRASGATSSTSTNLLTGLTIKTKGGTDKPTSSKVKGKPRTVFLEDVVID